MMPSWSDHDKAVPSGCGCKGFQVALDSRGTSQPSNIFLALMSVTNGLRYLSPAHRPERAARLFSAARGRTSGFVEIVEDAPRSD